ncbi:TetR/AcrR family transcriptional regulator [Cellulomonas sp. PhB150]|uniref:TetR/AcrR family transcriptional regulator n=1 Tax=Cellulomonas sp. PhB150 TaxID=2485188 RepID=UPI000FAEF385|nr:TetR/AcrR family transcriptional regulator [Cellulomonas sp. PhB150]ROS27735.1 TetR family transcriptional regulator [Cellulomonas sp. PhB150]
MPKVTEQYRVARRQEIADAALRAFRRKGFHATSMAEIIAESGLSAGAIYGHYPSKESLVVDVASRIVDARIADIEKLATLDPMPPPPALPRTIVTAMQHELGAPGIMLQMWGEGVTDPAIRELAASVVHRLRATMGRYVSLWQQRTHGLDPAEADALGAEQSVLVVAAVQSYIVQTSLIPGFDGDAYLRVQEKYLPR